MDNAIIVDYSLEAEFERLPTVQSQFAMFAGRERRLCDNGFPGRVSVVDESIIGTPWWEVKKMTSQELAEKWNRLNGVRAIRKMTEARKIKFRTRMKDATWAEDVKEALQKFPLKCFEGGRWQPNIDWFLRPDTVTKILEGEYDWSRQESDSKVSSFDGVEKIR